MLRNVEKLPEYPERSGVDPVGFMGGIYSLLDDIHARNLAEEAMRIPSPREGDSPL